VAAIAFVYVLTSQIGKIRPLTHKAPIHYGLLQQTDERFSKRKNNALANGTTLKITERHDSFRRLISSTSGGVLMETIIVSEDTDDGRA
jgi:hypothetical protein